QSELHVRRQWDPPPQSQIQLGERGGKRIHRVAHRRLTKQGSIDLERQADVGEGPVEQVGSGIPTDVEVQRGGSDLVRLQTVLVDVSHGLVVLQGSLDSADAHASVEW